MTRCPLFGTPRATSRGLLEITGDEIVAGLETKTDRLTGRQSQCDLDLDLVYVGNRIRLKTEDKQKSEVKCGAVTVTFKSVIIVRSYEVLQSQQDCVTANCSSAS